MRVAAKLMVPRVGGAMLQFPSLPHESKAAFPCSNAGAQGAAEPTDLEPLSLSLASQAARVQSEQSSLSPASQELAPESRAHRSR